jgi:hypothetical protein
MASTSPTLRADAEVSKGVFSAATVIVLKAGTNAPNVVGYSESPRSSLSGGALPHHV